MPLLSACQESRCELLKSYPLCFGSASSPPLRFNTTIDTVYIDSGTASQICNYSFYFGDQPEVSSDRNHGIENLAMEVGSCARAMMSTDFIEMTSLRHLVLATECQSPGDWISLGEAKPENDLDEYESEGLDKVKDTISKTKKLKPDWIAPSVDVRKLTFREWDVDAGNLSTEILETPASKIGMDSTLSRFGKSEWVDLRNKK